ncbi:MAG: hypothetical protein DBY25_00160 [Clostridiales bacterium]|nr:MAG: hypothetical protein DBY25_00160 [Clostridiales bacterium]
MNREPPVISADVEERHPAFFVSKSLSGKCGLSSVGSQAGCAVFVVILYSITAKRTAPPETLSFLNRMFRLYRKEFEGRAFQAA